MIQQATTFCIGPRKPQRRPGATNLAAQQMVTAGSRCSAPIHRGDKHEWPLMSPLAFSRAEITNHPHSSSRWTGPLTTYQLMSGRQIS